MPISFCTPALHSKQTHAWPGLPLLPWLPLLYALNLEAVLLSTHRDPFRGGDNILVMCDCYEPPKAVEGQLQEPKPIPTNTRYSCAAAMEKAKDQEPWWVAMVTMVVTPVTTLL
jgi:hypothetical protein